MVLSDVSKAGVNDAHCRTVDSQPIYRMRKTLTNATRYSFSVETKTDLNVTRPGMGHTVNITDVLAMLLTILPK